MSAERMSDSLARQVIQATPPLELPEPETHRGITVPSWRSLMKSEQTFVTIENDKISRNVEYAHEVLKAATWTEDAQYPNHLHELS
jgi:hypothetical protein